MINSRETRNLTKYIMIISIILLICISHIAICIAESPYTAVSSNINPSSTSTAQTDKYININKEIIPEKDFYLPYESIYIYIY